jgi:hypothetical protein
MLTGGGIGGSGGSGDPAIELSVGLAKNPGERLGVDALVGGVGDECGYGRKACEHLPDPGRREQDHV